MRYAGIDEYEVCNGLGAGVSLYIQGCHFHCKNCFNQETWDFDGGKEWTDEIEKQFLNLVDRPYIKRISILGGEPLSDENLATVLKVIIKIIGYKKQIWLYTGYTWENIFYSITESNVYPEDIKRKAIVELSDVLVDGQYVDSERDITLPFRGSRNQRIIDVQNSLDNKEICLLQL